MQQIQEEYVKLTETSQQGHQQIKETVKGASAVNLLPPTPQQGELGHIPDSIKIVMEQLSQPPLEDGQGATDKGENEKTKENTDKDGNATAVSVP